VFIVNNERAATLLNDDYRESFLKKNIKKFMPFYVREFLVRIFSGEGLFYKKEIDDKKIVFVHIPKAAGTAVSKALFGKRMGHFSIYAYRIANKRKYSDYYKFSIVRNPYSKVYSAWMYLKNSPHAEDRDWFSANLAKYISFEDFVLNWLSITNARSWKHFIPQVDYICINGVVAVDDVFKVENISCAEQVLSDRLGYEVKFSRSNVGISLFDINIYTDEMKRVLLRVYKEDFEVFGYE